MLKEISINTVRQLIDYSNGQNKDNNIWDIQLKGAVALHNTLIKENIAYLADEVGMGKTYIALGVAALFKHFNPGFRILYLTPRENIQDKWNKEFLNFTTNKWLITDNRVKSIQGTPAFKIRKADNLLHFAKQLVVNNDSDYILRMSSFSFGLSDTPGQWKKKRDELFKVMPWLDPSLFYLNSDKETFKLNYARAINSVIPHFDLIIVDEAHNLKHGLGENVAARNKLLSCVLGHPRYILKKSFPNFNLKFSKVLFISATPLETDYSELWNQLEVFNNGSKWDVLKNKDIDDQTKESSAKRFLIRRLTDIKNNGVNLTKNQYRQEWRNGGVTEHDLPLEIPDERQRLIVALVQKKVAEVVGNSQFKNSFQIGMLASFESFMETAKVKVDEESDKTFGESEQTSQQLEKDGIDTKSINVLSKEYSKIFREPMPHPKMDALVNKLITSFKTGKKALIFVRRIKSVKEITEKLNRAYDKYIKEYIISNIPDSLNKQFNTIWEQYEEERIQRIKRVNDKITSDPESDKELILTPEVRDEGGIDNFFAWFFRGEGPKGYLSGAAFKNNRLQGDGSVYSTFLEDNYLTILKTNCNDYLKFISEEVGFTTVKTEVLLKQKAYNIFKAGSKQKKYPRLKVYLSYQEASLIILSEFASNKVIQNNAEILLKCRFGINTYPESILDKLFPECKDYINTKTLITGIRDNAELNSELFHNNHYNDFEKYILLLEARRELFSSEVRLGHPLIDLWILAIKRLNSISLNIQEKTDNQDESLISEFVDLLTEQRKRSAIEFNSYKDLSDICIHFDLIVDVNFPEIRELSPKELPKLYGSSLSRQTPVAGMSGVINKSMVKQFLMPGYPFVLTTTDILKEGADLHTFCGEVIHYGISWTPSSMEQRTGRIDRIGSLTHRNITGNVEMHTNKLLQVYYPHLKDTIEKLQVENIYEKMNRFLRLLHKTLATDVIENNKVNIDKSILLPPKDIETIKESLKSTFEINESLLLNDDKSEDLNTFDLKNEYVSHLQAILKDISNYLFIDKSKSNNDLSYLGTVFINSRDNLHQTDIDLSGSRKQPFSLFLRSSSNGDGRVLIKCTSPIGKVEQNDKKSILSIYNAQLRIGFSKLCAIEDNKVKTFNLSIENELLFSPKTTQDIEVVDLIKKTVICADQLERTLLRKDQEMEVFNNDLKEEVKNV